MLYLASQSPRRRALLRTLGRPCRVVRSTYREVLRAHESPARNAMRNATGKVLGARLPTPRGAGQAGGIVIGADTILHFRGRVIGKPRTRREAARWLRALSGRRHWVYTGLCLRDLASGRTRTACARTRVTFKPLTDAAIARLFRRASPLDLAGGYALQADRGELIARLEGSRTNVIGLPLTLLRRELVALDRGR